jgi:hypothetical protein
MSDSGEGNSLNRAAGGLWALAFLGLVYLVVAKPAPHPDYLPIDCPRTGTPCRAGCAALYYCCRRRAAMELEGNSGNS